MNKDMKNCQAALGAHLRSVIIHLQVKPGQNDHPFPPPCSVTQGLLQDKCIAGTGQGWGQTEQEERGIRELIMYNQTMEHKMER